MTKRLEIITNYSPLSYLYLISLISIRYIATCRYRDSEGGAFLSVILNEIFFSGVRK